MVFFCNYAMDTIPFSRKMAAGYFLTKPAWHTRKMEKHLASRQIANCRLVFSLTALTLLGWLSVTRNCESSNWEPWPQGPPRHCLVSWKGKNSTDKHHFSEELWTRQNENQSGNHNQVFFSGAKFRTAEDQTAYILVDRWTCKIKQYNRIAKNKKNKRNQLR